MTDTDIDARPTLVVTGPTRGLGRALCYAVAASEPGARLILMGRHGPAMASVRTELTAADQQVEVVEADFTSTASTRAGAARVRALVASGIVGPVDGLALNAGVQTVDRLHLTADGLELTFGVNVVAPFLLVQELTAVLAPGASVVILGSGTHSTDRSERLVAHPRWEDPADLARAGLREDAAQAVAGQRAYATSKLAVNYLVHELQRRYHHQFRVNVYDPGMMPGTGLARDMNRFRQFMWDRVLPHLPLPGTSTPTRSAAVLAEMLLSRSFTDLRGGYVDIDRVSRSSDESSDPAREARLWAVLQELTAARPAGIADR